MSQLQFSQSTFQIRPCFPFLTTTGYWEIMEFVDHWFSHGQREQERKHVGQQYQHDHLD